MKSLYDYIIEASEEKTEDTKKTFKFDFSKFENAKETVESIVSMIEDFVKESTDTSITIECKNRDASKISGALEIIKSFIKTNASSTKRASDEQYAQFCQKQERALEDFEDFLKPVENPQPEPEEENDKNDEQE